MLVAFGVLRLVEMQPHHSYSTGKKRKTLLPKQVQLYPGIAAVLVDPKVHCAFGITKNSSN